MGKFVDIQKTPSTINNWRLVQKELVKREESLHKTISYLTAQEAHKQLLSGIPGGSEYKNLRQSLVVSEVSGTKRGTAAYAVHVPIRARRVRKIDVQKTVLYVRAKKRLTRADPAVQLLEDSGPWTADTIPFWPTKKEGDVIQRKVTKKEADKAAKAAKDKLSDVRSKLREMGRNIKKKKVGESGRIKRGGKAIPDVAMQALELEFGGSGKRSKPVFRKMVNSVKSSVLRMPNKHKIIQDTMTNPNSKRWKSFPPRVGKISSSKAGKFKGFQKRLGY